MMNKKGFTANTYIISLLLISGVIGICYIMLVDLAINYERFDLVDEGFQEKYNKLNDNADIVEGMLSATSSSSGFGFLDAAELFLSSTFTVITLLFSSIGTLASQTVGLIADFGVPSSVGVILITLFLSAITVSIIFIVINAVNKTNRM